MRERDRERERKSNAASKRLYFFDFPLKLVANGKAGRKKGEKIKQCQIWRQTQTDGERIYW